MATNKSVPVGPEAAKLAVARISAAVGDANVSVDALASTVGNTSPPTPIGGDWDMSSADDIAGDGDKSTATPIVGDWTKSPASPEPVSTVKAAGSPGAESVKPWGSNVTTREVV